MKTKPKKKDIKLAREFTQPISQIGGCRYAKNGDLITKPKPKKLVAYGWAVVHKSGNSFVFDIDGLYIALYKTKKEAIEARAFPNHWLFKRVKITEI